MSKINSNDQQLAEEKYEQACNYKAEGNFKSAIKLFEEALVINPNYVEALNNLGNIFNTMEKYEKALPYFLKADNIMPDEPIILNNLGIALMELGKLDEAKIKLETAIKKQPSFYQTYTNLGKVYTLKNDLVSAKNCLIKALEINPFDQKARLRLESAEELLNNLTTQEIAQLKNQLNKAENNNDKKNIDDLLKKAQLYNLGNQTGQAIYFYEEVIKIDPKQIDAINGLASAYLTSGNYEKTIDYSKKALLLNNESKEACFNLGAANFYLMKFEEALKSFLIFMKTVENEQDHFDANYMLGLTYYEMNNFNKAIIHLTKAAENNNPSRGEAYFALGNSYNEIGDIKNGHLSMNKAAFFGNENAKDWLDRNNPGKTKLWL